MKSIVGGAKMIGSSYINRGQSTIYYEKFDDKIYVRKERMINKLNY